MSRKIVDFVTEQVGQPVRLIRGTPDYYEIRKIEKEIHGEPVTPYPGDWQEISRKRHRDHSRYSLGYGSPSPGCMWCEDDRRRGELIRIEVQGKAAAEHAAARRIRRMGALKILGVVLGIMVLFGVGPLIALVVIL